VLEITNIQSARKDFIMEFLRKNILVILALIAAIVVGGLFFTRDWGSDQVTTQESSSTPSAQERIFVASLEIDTGEGVQTFDLEEGVGSSALEVTKKAVGDQIETSGEGANAFVTSLLGRQADTDKKEFWKLVINGEDAQVGAGSYLVKEGDSIRWEIDTF
jgi:hypothetical protein